MSKVIALAAVVIGGLAVPSQALAYNCTIPALVDPVKKAVCAQPLLAGMDREEVARRTALAAKLTSDAGTLITRDRRAFVTTRETCASDQRCLEATYRAQLRLYSRLDACARRQAAQQTFCVSRTTLQHREELHKSL
jgi:uncharacterized protein